MRPRIVAGLAALALLGGCCGPDPNLTPGGLGRPLLGVDFPETSEPGAVERAVLTVENPGPGDFTGISVAFVRVGPGRAGGELPHPIVDATARFDDEAVVRVRPKPLGVGTDGVPYSFGPLAAGESTTIEFFLRIPDVSGEAANSMLVYDSGDTDRSRGIRLSTVVKR